MIKSSLLNRLTLTIFLSVAFLSGGDVSLLQAQSFDHKAYPKLDFSFSTLELELGIQPQNLRIDGAASYEIEANISGADTLTLNASHLDISSVTVNDEQADYSLHDDSLYILVDDSSEIGQRYELNIRYSGRPQFGLLKNANGTVWTSQLPKAQRHWVPIVDNPRVTFETETSISVPSGYQSWASGRKTGEEAVSVDVMRYRFTSGEIPASSLSFGLGQFNTRSGNIGDKGINVIVEKSLADSVDIEQILGSAQEYVSQIEAQLELDLPYSALNIAVMEDHSWESKSWGASTVYLYTNGGDLYTQLLRGVIGQWFGSYQREDQWSQADAITLYQTLLYKTISEGVEELKAADKPETGNATIYENFGSNRWNEWQENLKNWQSPSIRSEMSASAAEVLNELPSVISWRDYAGFWYRRMGQPLFEMPSLDETKEKAVSESGTDSVSYEVVYALNEADGRLKLRFSATQGVFNELTTLTAYEVYPSNIDTSEVTFTGARDSVILQVDPTINTFQLDATAYPELTLDEYKPASFLISELQNGKTVEERAQAARKLGYHSDNPDLQLAIQDFMRKELEPEVRAALLHSLADITDGAAGTEQTFLDALQSENQKIRNAGLMALQNYEGNSTVLDRVQLEIRNAESFDIFQRAVKVLMAISSKEEFGSFVDSVVQQDTVGKEAIYMIQQLANMGGVEEAVAKAELFISEEYRYEIRSRALKILIQHDHTPSDWISRARNLLATTDPRIRYLLIEGLRRNKNGEVVAFIKEHIQDEYDARVHQSMSSLLE